MDSRLLSGALAAASAAALAANLFTDTFLPLVLGIALAGGAAGVAFQATKGRPGAERAVPALGIVAGLAAYSMYRVAMKALGADGFDVERLLRSVRILGYLPSVVLLAGALATFRFSDGPARVASGAAVALAVASGVVTGLVVGDADVPLGVLRPGGVDAFALAGFAVAAGAGAWTAWRHRAPAPTPVA